VELAVLRKTRTPAHPVRPAPRFLSADRSTQTAGWADYNGDGWLDLYIGNEATDRPTPGQRFENNRDGTFREVTRETGTAVVGYLKGVAWGDIGNDGWLDLMVLGYRFLRPRTCAADVAAEYLGLPYQAELPRLYRNLGDGTFRDVTRDARLSAKGIRRHGLSGRPPLPTSTATRPPVPAGADRGHHTLERNA
jgi:hypothetical protein